MYSVIFEKNFRTFSYEKSEIPTVELDGNGQLNQRNIVGDGLGDPVLMHDHILPLHEDDLLALLLGVGAIVGAQVDIHTGGQAVRAMGGSDDPAFADDAASAPGSSSGDVQE